MSFLKNILVISGLLLVAGCAGSRMPPSSFDNVEIGRDIDRFSIDADSSSWIFTECSRVLDPKGSCEVLRLQSRTGQLGRYLMPAGYLCSYASFSPSGKRIVLTRRPVDDGSREGFERSRAQSELAIMNEDGSDFHVVPAAPGSKLGAFFSPDERKLAFWRAARTLPPGSRMQSMDFEIRELDLNTSKESPFSNGARFISGGPAQYVSDDEILTSSYAPMASIRSLDNYRKKYNGSEIYKLARGEAGVPEPIFTNLRDARDVSVDASGNIYLEGSTVTEGLSFFRIAPSGDFMKWREYAPVALRGLKQTLVSPNGEYMAYLYFDDYGAKGTRHVSFGKLDLATSVWSPVLLPSLTSAKPIFEPHRILWRHQHLREWCHEQETEQIFTRGPGARSTPVARAA